MLLKMSKNASAVAISMWDLHMREAREEIKALRILKGSKTFKEPEHCLEPSKAKENTPEVTATNSLSGAKPPCFPQLKLGICILISKGWVGRYEILVCC